MFRRRNNSPDNVAVVGVTGGIGSGKSTVCKIFEEKGAVAINADELGHELLAANNYLKRQLYEQFGEIILGADRQIDRTKLSNIVFSSPNELGKLNQIVHPVLLMKLRNKINKYKRNLKKGLVVVDAALIVEWSIDAHFDTIIVVTATKKNRVDRLKKEKGLTAKEAAARMDAQLPEKIKQQHADYIIKNDGALKELRSRTLRIIQEIKKRHGQ